MLQSKREKQEKRGVKHMLFNTTTNGDPRSFLYYKGDFYINGSEIILKDEYINSHKWNGDKLWKYARFDHQTTYNGGLAYFFCQSRSDWLSFNKLGIDYKTRDDYAPYFVVDTLELENLIEEFSHPIKLQHEETEAILEAIVEPKRDIDNPSLMLMWLVYIAVMVGSLIFKQFYIVWGVASFLFFRYRKEMLDR